MDEQVSKPTVANSITTHGYRRLHDELTARSQ